MNLLTAIATIIQTKKSQLVFLNNTKPSKNHCHVCGMDEWCGTDGCPMDPQ